MVQKRCNENKSSSFQLIQFRVIKRKFLFKQIKLNPFREYSRPPPFLFFFPHGWVLAGTKSGVRTRVENVLVSHRPSRVLCKRKKCQILFKTHGRHSMGFVCAIFSSYFLSCFSIIYFKTGEYFGGSGKCMHVLPVWFG